MTDLINVREQSIFYFPLRSMLNTYWTRSSLMLKISMLPNVIVDDGEAGDDGGGLTVV